jgi:hypothetical protein
VNAHAEEDVSTVSNGKATFVLRLRPEPGCRHPIHALRRVLKFALRQCQLRCVEAQEIPASKRET